MPKQTKEKLIETVNGSINQNADVNAETSVVQILRKLGYTNVKRTYGNRLIDITISTPNKHYIQVKARQSSTTPYPKMTPEDKEELIYRATRYKYIPILFQISLDTNQYEAINLLTNKSFVYLHV